MKQLRILRHVISFWILRQVIRWNSWGQEFWLAFFSGLISCSNIRNLANLSSPRFEILSCLIILSKCIATSLCNGSFLISIISNFHFWFVLLFDLVLLVQKVLLDLFKDLLYLCLQNDIWRTLSPGQSHVYPFYCENAHCFRISIKLRWNSNKVVYHLVNSARIQKI